MGEAASTAEGAAGAVFGACIHGNPSVIDTPLCSVFALFFTKTVKTPGEFSAETGPHRLGALRPSRRISSTLKLVLRGFDWQSGILLTQTWSQGRLVN